jgi:spore coat polysaccharide biosynthesis protein SpsF (cytidylyltransferase family)
MRTIAVVQARIGSTRLPGKVLELVGGRPLVLRVVEALRAASAIEDVVVATTATVEDDALVALLTDRGVAVHRGPTDDVLTRVHDAATRADAELVVRVTADNPFPDPAVAAAQVARAVDDDLDYVGTAGWPRGIAVEVAPYRALSIAAREATSPAEREHVMPFLYTRPGRFRIGHLDPADVPGAAPLPEGRFTVDTPEDLAFARAVADRLGDIERPGLGDLRRVLLANPALVALNAHVEQRPWTHAAVR